MIETIRQYDQEKIVVSCDSCSHQEERQRVAWHIFIAALKAAGWAMKKWGKVWNHHCPACMEKERVAFNMKFSGEEI